MGQTLSEPITSKESTSLCNNKVCHYFLPINKPFKVTQWFRCVFSSKLGPAVCKDGESPWKMHIVTFCPSHQRIPVLRKIFWDGKCSHNETNIWCFNRYFGVFDGHGGSKVAAHAANNLHRTVVQRPEYKEGDILEAIKQGFLECDRTMRTAESLKEEMAGCTAITVFIRGKELWCANAGDSRCVAGVAGVAKPLSTDHKPMVGQ